MREGQAGRVNHYKYDRPTGFLLTDRCAIHLISAGGDILDPDGDDITAAKLTVDRQIEHGQVASVSSGSTRRVWVAAVASPRSACPCSRACGLDFSTGRPRYLTWSYSSVTEDDHHARPVVCFPVFPVVDFEGGDPSLTFGEAPQVRLARQK